MSLTITNSNALTITDSNALTSTYLQPDDDSSISQRDDGDGTTVRPDEDDDYDEKTW